MPWSWHRMTEINSIDEWMLPVCLLQKSWIGSQAVLKSSSSSGQRLEPLPWSLPLPIPNSTRCHVDVNSKLLAAVGSKGEEKIW
jgi:hypothetical protein